MGEKAALSKDEKEKALSIAKEIKEKTADPKEAIKRIHDALLWCHRNAYDGHHMSWAHRLQADAVERQALLKSEWEEADEDKSNTLDFEEAVGSVMKLVGYMNIKVPKKSKFDEWMKKFDKDGNGVLDFQEFSKGFDVVIKNCIKEAEKEKAEEEHLDPDQINTILGIVEDFDTECTVEEPRVVAEDEDDDDAEERSLWGDGDKEPGAD